MSEAGDERADALPRRSAAVVKTCSPILRRYRFAANGVKLAEPEAMGCSQGGFAWDLLD